MKHGREEKYDDDAGHMVVSADLRTGRSTHTVTHDTPAWARPVVAGTSHRSGAILQAM